MGEEEDSIWALALTALAEDEQLEMERAKLVDMMPERASMHTIPEDLDRHVNENTQNDPGEGSSEHHVLPSKG
eukprot:SAG11_NODE_413_length_9694_cov_2.695675_7_plen_73_part_00